MPRAHLCTSCGEDLALIAPRREPHYGWPMIACPGCKANAVRWEGHDRRMWRRTRKRAKAIAGVIGRLGGFALLTVVTLSATAALIEESRWIVGVARLPGPLAVLGFSSDASLAAQRAIWLDHSPIAFVLAGWVFSAFAVAVGLAVLLRHLRWWITVPAWGIWMFCAWAVGMLGVPTVGLLLLPQDGEFLAMLAIGNSDIDEMVAWSIAFVLVAALLMPLAVTVRRVARRLVRRQRWRVRRRIRKWRQTA